MEAAASATRCSLVAAPARCAHFHLDGEVDTQSLSLCTRLESIFCVQVAWPSLFQLRHRNRTVGLLCGLEDAFQDGGRVMGRVPWAQRHTRRTWRTLEHAHMDEALLRPARDLCGVGHGGACEATVGQYESNRHSCVDTRRQLDAEELGLRHEKGGGRALWRAHRGCTYTRVRPFRPYADSRHKKGFEASHDVKILNGSPAAARRSENFWGRASHPKTDSRGRATHPKQIVVCRHDYLF